MRDRERACVFYIHETNCAKGHKGTFNKACQTCKDYKPNKKGNIRRKDLRQEKQEKWVKDKRNWDY